MKYLIVPLALLCGCNHSNQVIEAIDYPIPPPPPPPNIMPSSAPPNFKPDITELAEVQINPIPHPFNLDGSRPYAVWVNGERLPLNNVQIRALAQSLNLKFEQPENTAKIHNGEGWQYPLNLHDGSKNPNNRKHEQEKAFIRGL